MDSRTYSLAAGSALLAAAVAFFVLPGILDLEPFIPVLIAIACVMLSAVILVSGLSERR